VINPSPPLSVKLLELRMAQLGAELFTGGDLPAEEFNRCEVANRGEAIDDAFRRLAGWGGGPAAGVLLHLSPDNERVVGGEIVTRGADAREITWEAAKVWPEADKRVTITFVLPVLENFLFTGGSMASDIIDGAETVHFLHITREGRPQQPLLNADLVARGIGAFCLRMVCTLSGDHQQGLGLKYYIMLFPASKEEMQARSDLTTRAEWPGLKLADGVLPLLPMAARRWGCPILPLLLPGQPFAAVARAPSSAALRDAIGAIMRTAGAPEVSRSGASTTAKWDKIVRNPATLVRKPTTLLWPATQPAASQQATAGMILYLNKLPDGYWIVP